MKNYLLCNFHLRKVCHKVVVQRWLRQSVTGVDDDNLTIHLKHVIEKYWRPEISNGSFDINQNDKFYVLPMFPYPSGSLHMGHVRVYTISDAVARYYRMCKKNVFHPIGWDAFGLPAENAAIQRDIEPATWTAQNTEHMKEQLKALSCSFDWQHELSTCQPEYYKWTQKLFIMLHNDGLAYQNEALVNWDPVDKTVLADEQVDVNNCSWRSGAKVEKKLLKQWFIRTTMFAKRLLQGLEDPSLRDWKDIKNLQRHWIGDCNGYAFQLLTSASSKLRIWTMNPEYFRDPRAFLVLKKDHFLAREQKHTEILSVENPFEGSLLPVVFSDDVNYPAHCDVYLASPSNVPDDLKFLLKCTNANLQIKTAQSMPTKDVQKTRTDVLEAAIRSRIGGQQVSSKLQDWLVSRQRYWGTPIPIVHCPKCGAVPVPDEQLPVMLPDKKSLLENRENALRCTCPRCQNKNAQRESDTMDTFVDSSWYYLRFLDAHNKEKIFDRELIDKFMPVDLYIGGKEHAVLHLYYARFINHYLHSRGLVPTSEPFSRLLVQGMVMGRSYRVKKTGKYVTEDDVIIVNAKKNMAALRENNEPVTMNWEKMSKSKYNGVDPMDMFNEYGTDTTRLIILADVAPTSHRNWSSATFPGILNWQKRLWLTMTEFIELRQSSDPSQIFIDETLINEWEEKLSDARNYYIKGATFNYCHTHQLSVAISKMQGLTNSVRRTPKVLIPQLKQYERALASQIMMLAPMAPAFASELWSKFCTTKNRLNIVTSDWDWSQDVLQQKWPEIDEDYKLDLTIKINAYENCVIKIPKKHINKISHNDALDMAFNTHSVTEYLTGKKIGRTNYVLYPDLEAVLNIYVDKAALKVQSDEATTVNEKKIG